MLMHWCYLDFYCLKNKKAKRQVLCFFYSVKDYNELNLKRKIVSQR